ncbi:MAG TPA: dihydrolipoyl dehydrogenase [Pirellulales bacterium]|jgi:dihydrolipoamide dehydrogenase|nr:dihydrolipoyl dehydrogenase [Pirellulales bacterium]
MEHDLLVIGAGPGGYVAAIRAAQLGMNVACVDKEMALGGTCLRIGCIPSKALLESSELFAEAKHNFAAHGIQVPQVGLDLATMLKRKDGVVSMLTRGVDGLFKKNKITRYLGNARFAGPGKVIVAGEKEETEVRAKHIIIATGSKSSTLPGIVLDGVRVGTSTEALSYDPVPKSLIVIGAGYIGLELGSVWNRLGAKVTVLEYLDRIFPGTDGEIAAEALKIFKKQGIEFRLSTRVTSAKADGDTAVVEYEGGAPLRAERVLVSVGRAPNTDGLALDTVGVELDARGRIKTGEHFATTAPNIYAIGDVIVGPMLAHKAEEEGVACVEYLATGYGHVNYDAIPSVAYTHPEVAGVGKTEEQLQTDKVPYRKGKFPFRANGRALALGDSEGQVKILAHAETDRVLGVHIIGPRAGDLIAEATAAIEFGASSEDIARTCHAHPTLPEVTKEAALAVLGRAIHM